MKIECNSRIFTYPDKIHKTKDNVLGTMDNIYLSCCISKKHCMVYNQGCPYKLKKNKPKKPLTPMLKFFRGL